MLTEMRLRNFKCFEDQRIPLAPLTLFSGVNGMGKSSAIQALLALIQTGITGYIRKALFLNGEFVRLGTADDILFNNASHDVIGIDLVYKDEQYLCRYKKTEDRLENCNKDLKINLNEKKMIKIWDNFAYLNAERCGPRVTYPVMDDSGSLNFVGNKGEFCSIVLSEFETDNVVLPDVLLAQDDGEILPYLLQQTEAWLSRLGKVVRVHVQKYSSMDLVNLEFSFPKEGSQRYRATNVGFGLTYSLPIFVAVLSAQPGAFIIIENPEAHLHPKGQSIMGEFLVRAAASGVQILLETHSDHLLNGVRVAVKNGLLEPDKVALNFFTRGEGPAARVLTPKMDKNGRLNEWPEDFFDEWEKNLAELL